MELDISKLIVKVTLDSEFQRNLKFVFEYAWEGVYRAE